MSYAVGTVNMRWNVRRKLERQVKSKETGGRRRTVVERRRRRKAGGA